MTERDEPRLPCGGGDEKRSDVLDHAADMGYDAIDFGDVDPLDVVMALEGAAREIEEERVENE